MVDKTHTACPLKLFCWFIWLLFRLSEKLSSVAKDLSYLNAESVSGLSVASLAHAWQVYILIKYSRC